MEKGVRRGGGGKEGWMDVMEDVGLGLGQGRSECCVDGMGFMGGGERGGDGWGRGMDGWMDGHSQDKDYER